jgi:hypothetical protein
MAPVRVTPEEFQDKHARRLKAALPDMTAGIERVTESPTAKAAAKQDKMLTKLTAAVQDGRWANRLKAVSLDEWKFKMLQKGVGRVSAGIDAAKAKTIDFASQLIPAVERAQASIATMPDTTTEENINRMVSYVREMAKFKKK